MTGVDVRVGRWLAAGAAAVLLPVGFAGPAAAAGARPAAGGVVRVAQFQPWSSLSPPEAVTYDREMAPPGAVIAVGELSLHGRTLVVLHVVGLLPGHEYGAHVHRGRCGATPAASGGHYQNVPDPLQPSTDPRYANPRNEVWLDVRTDAGGSGTAFALQLWEFRRGEANSVVLHEHGTGTMPGQAGTAGARVGCLTVPF